MKINGAGSTTPAGRAGSAKASSSGARFSLGGLDDAAETAGAAKAQGVGALTSMSALLALQSVEDPLQRKRRAVARAGKILDALDELKLGVLDGLISPSGLQRLVDAVREERAGADDPKLQSLLNDIETRAAVELAKLQPAGVA